MQELIKVTEENYFSQEVGSQYLSNSQLKVYDVTEGGCPAKWYAQYITGEFTPDRNRTPLIVGNYVGTAFESEEAHAEFVENNADKIFVKLSPGHIKNDLEEIGVTSVMVVVEPSTDDIKIQLEIHSVDFKKSWTKPKLKGAYIDAGYNYEILCSSKEDFFENWKTEKLIELAVSKGLKEEFLNRPRKRADYILADKMIETGMNDEAFMSVMSGEHEVIFTAELFGHPFKVRLDVWSSEKKAIVDLKTCKDFSSDWKNINGKNVKVPFYEVWNYFRQLGVYRKVAHLATGILSEFQDIAALTKQDPPDKDIIDFSDADHLERFDIELDKVEIMIGEIIEIKAGNAEPKQCGTCEVCRASKQITEVKSANAFLEYHRGN